MRAPATALILAALTLAGCGAVESRFSAPIPTRSATPSPIPVDLTCPTNQRVATDGGYRDLSLEPGYPSREAAVQAWLAAGGLAGGGRLAGVADSVVIDIDRDAWILRADGTAVAWANVVGRKDYQVYGYLMCAEVG